MEHSASIAKLSQALAKAQGEIRGATKDTQNPFFKSKYADLASVRDAIQEPLSRAGISYVQSLEGGPDVLTITTLLACGDEWIKSSFQLKPVKPDPQGMGSAATYGRRYALMAAVGVAPEDDDGNAASNPKNGQGAPANNVTRGNPLRQEFAALSFELDACKSQEQIDLLFDSPEFKDFEERDSKQPSGMSFAGMMRDKAEQMKKKLPEKIRYEGNKIVATSEYESAMVAENPGFSSIAVKCMEQFDIVDSVDQFKAAQKFATEHQKELTPTEKTALNALSKKVGAKLREAA